MPVDAKNIYAQIRFEPASWAPSSAAAYITGKTVDEMVIENSFSDPSILPVRSKPFLKYVPEPVACTVTPSGCSATRSSDPFIRACDRESYHFYRKLFH